MNNISTISQLGKKSNLKNQKAAETFKNQKYRLCCILPGQKRFEAAKIFFDGSSRLAAYIYK